MDAATAIFEQIRPYVARLDEAERLALIRSITLVEPEEQTDELLPEDDIAAQLQIEAAVWFARPKLERQQYQGQYIAIYQGEVVDHDPEQRGLYIRIHKRFGSVPVLLIYADWDKLPELTIHSVGYGR